MRALPSIVIPLFVILSQTSYSPRYRSSVYNAFRKVNTHGKMPENFGFDGQPTPTLTVDGEDGEIQESASTGASLDRLAAYGDITIVSALLAGASLAMVVEVDSDAPSASEGAALVILMLVASVNLSGTILLVTQLYMAKRFGASHDDEEGRTNDAKARRNSMSMANNYLASVQKSRRFAVRGIIFSVPLFLVGMGIFTLARSTKAASIVAAVIPMLTAIVTCVGLYQQSKEHGKVVALTKAREKNPAAIYTQDKPPQRSSGSHVMSY